MHTYNSKSYGYRSKMTGRFETLPYLVVVALARCRISLSLFWLSMSDLILKHLSKKSQKKGFPISWSPCRPDITIPNNSFPGVISIDKICDRSLYIAFVMI